MYLVKRPTSRPLCLCELLALGFSAGEDTMPDAVVSRLSSTAEDLEDITATAQQRAEYVLVMVQIPCCLTIDLCIWAISAVLVSIHIVAAALSPKIIPLHRVLCDKYCALSALHMIAGSQDTFTDCPDWLVIGQDGLFGDFGGT